MNEVTNYIFGTLRRQDIALRGMTRDLRNLKRTNRTNLILATVGTYSMMCMLLEIKHMKDRMYNMNKELEDLKAFNGFKEEVN